MYGFQRFLTDMAMLNAQCSMPIPCRLLIDPPAAGDWNMAIDEVLLRRTASDCVWRFYQWSEPTLSLGYFQSLAERQHHAASRGCPVVRRTSGGGAIIHDIELTYSFVVPPGHALSVGCRRLYDVVHAVLIETLAEFGVEAALFEPTAGRSDNATSDARACGRPFLCFQRRSPGDVVVGADKVAGAKIAGAKIAGSAQRRQLGTVLQHGSVLLGRSRAAPELPGLNQLAGLNQLGDREIGADGLIEAWLPRIERGLGLAFSLDRLSREELADARRVATEKYASSAWTKSRGRG